MKVSTEIDNKFGYEKITQLVDNIPLNPLKVTSTSTNLVNSTLLLFTILQKKKIAYFFGFVKNSNIYIKVVIMKM
jgi:hypothetical protein